MEEAMQLTRRLWMNAGERDVKTSLLAQDVLGG